MSSILKALRKIEEEKRSAGQSAPDLRVDQGLKPAKSRWLPPLLAGAALGALTVGLVIGLTKEEPPHTVKTQVVSESLQKASPGPQPVPAEVVSGSAAKTADVAAGEGSDQAQAPAVRGLQEAAETVRVPVVVLPPEPIAWSEQKKTSLPGAVGSAPKTIRSVKSNPAKTTRPESAPRPPAENLKDTPPAKISGDLPEGVSLRVTEIYFQGDSENSLAVVNDLPVMVGTRIDSAVVTGIQPDRVHFRIGTMSYVQLVKTR